MSKKLISIFSLFLFLVFLFPSFSVQGAPPCPQGYILTEDGNCAYQLQEIVTTAPPPGGCQRSILAPTSAPTSFKGFVCTVLGIIDSLVPVLMGLTLIVFLWGLAKFILAGGDEKKIESGRTLMLWGIIALFIMVSVWGIVNILYGSFFPGSIRLPLLKE